MARQTRAERRARREARERSMAGAGGGGRGGDLAVAGAGGDGRSAEPAARPVHARPPRGGGLIGFVRESIAELRKVEWPGQNQVVQGTVVVIIACVIIGTYLYVADQIFNKFVSKVLLGQ